MMFFIIFLLFFLQNSLHGENDLALESRIDQLFWAIETDKKIEFDIFFSSIGPSHKNKDGQTLLCAAIENGRDLFVIELLKQGAILSEKNHQGIAPLECAVAEHNYLALILLLQTGLIRDDEIFVQDAFVKALKNGDGDSALLLLLYGGDPKKELVDFAKEQPWWSRPETLKLRLVKVLLQLAVNDVDAGLEAALQACITELESYATNKQSEVAFPQFEEDDIIRFRLFVSRLSPHTLAESLSLLSQSYFGLCGGVFQQLKVLQPSIFSSCKAYIESLHASQSIVSEVRVSAEKTGMCLLL